MSNTDRELVHGPWTQIDSAHGKLTKLSFVCDHSGKAWVPPKDDLDLSPEELHKKHSIVGAVCERVQIEPSEYYALYDRYFIDGGFQNRSDSEIKNHKKNPPLWFGKYIGICVVCGITHIKPITMFHYPGSRSQGDVSSVRNKTRASAQTER